MSSSVVVFVLTTMLLGVMAWLLARPTRPGLIDMCVVLGVAAAWIGLAMELLGS